MRHSFNFFKVKAMTVLANKKDVLVQDSAGEIYVFQITSDKAVNMVSKFYIEGDIKNTKIVILPDKVIALS